MYYSLNIESDGLHSGAIAGIILAVVLVILVAVLILFVFLRSRYGNYDGKGEVYHYKKPGWISLIAG